MRKHKTEFSDHLEAALLQAQLRDHALRKRYQTTANIYTHIKEEMLKKATVDLEGVFKKRAGKE